MRKLVLALMLVLVVSSFTFAATIDSKLVDVMKSAKGLIPVIVQMNPGAKHVDVKALGGNDKDHWTVINGFSADLPVAAINALKQNPNVYALSYDQEVKANMNVAAHTVRADEVWAAGVTGRNVAIAIVDTGIYPHADLSGRIIAFKDYVNGRTSAYDDNGHGTHCAGIAAGAGSTYRGIAPGAKLVGVKVLNSSGSGSFSTIISGINWVVTNRATYNIKVLSLSLGGTITQSSVTDPMCSAVRSAWNAGIVVCVAAGNSGPYAYSINTPGNEPLVITVGACNETGTGMMSFSSVGPTSIDGWAKPDCVAPGENITSCKNATTGYVTMSGTSMATPIVAGIAALYFEVHPSDSPATFKSKLKSECHPIPGVSPNQQGAGLVDAYDTVF